VEKIDEDLKTRGEVLRGYARDYTGIWEKGDHW